MTWLRRQKLLFDVQEAARLLVDLNEGIPSLAAFRANVPVRGATLWHLVVIGEAMTRLRREFPTLALPDAAAIIGLRNRLVHAYDGIEDETVWLIVRRHLPVLLNAVDALLATDEPQPNE